MNKLPHDIIQTCSKISIHYTLSLENNNVVDTTKGSIPLAFKLGDGTFPIAVEQHFLGMKTGDTKKQTIIPEKGWGFPENKNIKTLPLDDFPEKSVLEVGNVIEFTLQNADDVAGTIISISNSCVDVDFSPPLAGHTVVFEFEIVSVNNTI